MKDQIPTHLLRVSWVYGLWWNTHGHPLPGSPKQPHYKPIISPIEGGGGIVHTSFPGGMTTNLSRKALCVPQTEKRV